MFLHHTLGDCAIITWRGEGGGAGKGVKYAPKLSHTPPLKEQKLISTPPPHIMIILRLTTAPPPSPCCKKSPPIDSLIPGLLVGFLPLVQTSLQMTLRRMSKYHQNGFSELVSSSHEMGDSSSSAASLALRFPRT